MEGQLSLDDLLKFMTKKGASDLHLKPMRPPLLRIGGNLTPIKSVPLKPKEVEEMIMALLTPTQRQKLEEHQSVDLGYGVPGVARFRCNVFVQRGSYAAVFRRIPFDIKNYDDLNLPDVVATFAHLPAGMVLITGPTGSGKSTTPGRDHSGHLALAPLPHRHRRGPDRVPVRRPHGHRLPARGRHRHPGVSRGVCATPCGRTPTSSWSARCATRRPWPPR